MNTSKIVYQGGLRTKSVHLQSGNSLITDAPTDNHGQGEAFSPTDLVASALVSCMFTIMGVRANANGWSIEGIEGVVLKTMAARPRRIAKLDVSIRNLPHLFSEKEKEVLKQAALTCPVY